MEKYCVFSSETYKKFYKNITSDKELFEVLKAMPADYEVTVEDAEALAEKFMAATANYEYVRDCALDENAMAAIEDCIETLSRKTQFTKTEILHRMNCGLSLSDDSEKLGSLCSSEEVFQQYMKTQGKTQVSEEELMELLKEKLSHIGLASDHLRDYAKRMNKTKDPLASSVVLGKNGYKFRCIAAMDIYLSNKDLSVEEAVCMASTQADLQAVASAVRHGEVSEKYAQKLIKILFATVRIVLNLLALVFSGTPLSLWLKGVSALLQLNQPKVKTKAVGAYFAKNRYLSNERQKVIEGIEQLADCFDEETEEKEEVTSKFFVDENIIVLTNPLNA
ncbi:MAG: hypothetical protein IJ262_03885 [Clostridia bacterium]|nr:hypothetical protein [Clostridia bacterium]